MTDVVSSHHQAPLQGAVLAPGDKSCSHRALMLASVADGVSSIAGLLHSGDVNATAFALRHLGVQFDQGVDGALRVMPPSGGFQSPKAALDVDNSGTSARLLLGLLAGRGMTAEITGDASLRRRPMRRVIDPLRQMGAQITLNGDSLPARITPVRHLSGLIYEMPVASAQVKSALILAALAADGETAITEPAPTRDHTERMLRFMGARIDAADGVRGRRIVRFAGGQRLHAAHLDVPGDPSSAAFLLSAAAMVPGSDVTVRGVMINPYRNGLIDTLRDMGANISFSNEKPCGGETVADIRFIYAPLRAVHVPVERIPSMIDEVPILAAVAATVPGQMRIPGLAELRVKESNRLDAIAKGLSACGVAVRVEGDDLTIHGHPDRIAGGTAIAANLDHRIAMSFLILGLVAKNPVVVTGTETIASSFPAFFDVMRKLGADFASMRGTGTVGIQGEAVAAAQLVDPFRRA